MHLFLVYMNDISVANFTTKAQHNPLENAAFSFHTSSPLTCSDSELLEVPHSEARVSVKRLELPLVSLELKQIVLRCKTWNELPASPIVACHKRWKWCVANCREVWISTEHQSEEAKFIDFNECLGHRGPVYIPSSPFQTATAETLNEEATKKERLVLCVRCWPFM
jgi:hypothetical protein